MPESTLNQRLRFEEFELDLRAYELRHNGTPIRLERQPMDLLILLTERRGQLVSRENIVERLWGPGVFVDVETGINTAIRKLRTAFGDSADDPRFIETVPRRGYRFVATVEESPNGIGSRESAIEAFPKDGDLSGTVHKELVQEANRTPAIITLAGAVLLVLVAATVWFSLPRPPKVTTVVKITSDGRAKLPLNLFVTDGVHLYFMEGSPYFSGSGIAQVAAIGGETSQIQTPLKQMLAMYAISPDFSEVLLARGVDVGNDPSTGRTEGAAEVWAQPLPAGTPHRVGNFYATAACYSPDGTHVIYADGPTLMMIRRDGSNPRKLARVKEVVRGLRYSPDGKRIRFQITREGFDSSALWEIDGSGNNLHPLLPNWKESPFQCCGNWSPDGKYYFFQGGHGNEQAIWVMPEHQFNLGGLGSPSRLISGPLRLSAPVPSSDGKRLFVMGQDLRVEPVRYDTKTHRFESYLNDISASSFEFSRDRKWIAYVSYPDMSLWRSRADGSDKMQLTFPPVRAYGPRWSPDGSKVAYTDVHFYRPWKISVISSSGGPPQPIPSSGPDEEQGDPNWLPDGNSIIYRKFDQGSGMIVRLDLVTAKISPIPESEGYFSPRLSPDGRYIAAFSQGARELLLFDSKTNHWSSLARGELFAYNSWSNDGKYVYVRVNSPKIVRVRIRDAKMEEVVSLRDLPQVVDMLAGWIGLTPDNDPIVIRDRSTQEIYALNLQ